MSPLLARVRLSPPAAPEELPELGLDPAALIAEARRRQRRRRLGAGAALLVAAVAVTWLYVAVIGDGGAPPPAKVGRPGLGETTVRLRLEGFGAPIPTMFGRGTCPEGRTRIAIKSIAGDGLGTLDECVRTIAKTDVPNYGVRRIVATAIDTYSLPGGAIVTRETHVVSMARDQRHTTAIFRGRVLRGTGRYAHAHGTISGGGPGVGSKGTWVVRIRLET